MYLAINLIDTEPLDSFYTITGITFFNEKERIKNRNCVILLIHSAYTLNSKDNQAQETEELDLFETQEDSIDPIADIQISVINELLYYKKRWRSH